MRRSFDKLIRQRLKQSPDGVPTPELAVLLGLDVDAVRVRLRKMPDTYIDRWVLTGKGGNPYVAVWRAVDVPEDCPKPKGTQPRISMQQRVLLALGQGCTRSTDVHAVVGGSLQSVRRVLTQMCERGEAHVAAFEQAPVGERRRMVRLYAAGVGPAVEKPKTRTPAQRCRDYRERKRREADGAGREATRQTIEQIVTSGATASLWRGL